MLNLLRLGSYVGLTGSNPAPGREVGNPELRGSPGSPHALTPLTGVLLLRWNYRLLAGLRHTELDDRLGWNLDFSTRLRISSLPGVTLCFDELANSGDRKCSGLLGLAYRNLRQLIEDLIRGLFRHPELVGEVGGQLALCH